MISKSCSVVIDGNHTDVVFNSYHNRIFLVISQYKKLGSFVSVTKESAVPGLPGNVYDTKVIFGKDEPEIHAASRFIAQELLFDKPLLISICLKDFEVSTLRTIVKAIRKVTA